MTLAEKEYYLGTTCKCGCQKCSGSKSCRHCYEHKAAGSGTGKGKQKC